MEDFDLARDVMEIAEEATASLGRYFQIFGDKLIEETPEATGATRAGWRFWRNDESPGRRPEDATEGLTLGDEMHAGQVEHTFNFMEAGLHPKTRNGVLLPAEEAALAEWGEGD